MYVHTKLANKCIVTEKADKQHIIETADGYIIRCLLYKDCVYFSAVLNSHKSFHAVNTVAVPRNNYRAARAALKAFVMLAPLHERSTAYVY